MFTLLKNYKCPLYDVSLVNILLRMVRPIIFEALDVTLKSLFLLVAGSIVQRQAEYYIRTCFIIHT